MADSPARSVYKKESVVRGHHIYKTSWTPVIGEELPAEREENNEHDEHAVAVRKNGVIVGHVPRSFRIMHKSYGCAVLGPASITDVRQNTPGL